MDRKFTAAVRYRYARCTKCTPWNTLAVPTNEPALPILPDPHTHRLEQLVDVALVAREISGEVGGLG
jgi:hypothetical protein